MALCLLYPKPQVSRNYFAYFFFHAYSFLQIPQSHLVYRNVYLQGNLNVLKSSVQGSGTLQLRMVEGRTRETRLMVGSLFGFCLQVATA